MAARVFSSSESATHSYTGSLIVLENLRLKLKGIRDDIGLKKRFYLCGYNSQI